MAKTEKSKTSAGKKGRKAAINLAKASLRGQILSIDNFLRHWKGILAVVVLVMIYITNRYQCATRMEEIHRLKQELSVAETERVRMRSLYMSAIRETSMQQMVDRHRLGLKIQEQPPYYIQY